jgi:hypothetical protein
MYDMGRTRTAAVAGYFYPADPGDLAAAVKGYIENAVDPPAELRGRCPKALIGPHAGYAYSGPVAGSAYALVLPFAGALRRIVLLGPAHRVRFRGLAASTAETFATPLGEMQVDSQAIAAASELPGVTFNDHAHAQEHSLEAHLPFLQIVCPQALLIPFAVCSASAEQVADVLDLLWGGPETLIVVSSDLSHYYDYATARRLDSETSAAIVRMKPEELGPDSACGRDGICGLLQASVAHGLTAWAVDLCSSGDTAGDRDKVVGYGAYAFA